MSLHQRIRLSLAFLGVMSMVVATSSVSVASAASPKTPSVQSNPPPFTVTGAIVPIASPQAYQAANPNAAFFTDTQTLPYLSDVRYYVVTGVFQITQQPGTQAAGVELAINPVTHTQLFAIGTPTPAFVAQRANDDAQLRSTTGSSSTIDSPGSSSSGVSSLAVSPRSSSTSSATHFMDTYWKDRATLTMNEVRDEVSFNYDGTHVSNGNLQWSLYALPDGWYYDNVSNQSYYEDNQTWIFSYTYVDFHNPLFCWLIGGDATNVYYHSNTISVYADGTYSSWIDTWSSGGCTNLIYWSFYDG